MTTNENNNGTSRVNREWTHTGKPLSSFPEAEDEYSGFCPILPVRMTGISDFDSIRSATRNYINKHRKNFSVMRTLSEMGVEDASKMTDEQVEEFTTKQAWTFMRPNTDKYRQNVVDIREYFKQVTGGYVQPMWGRVALEIDVVCPSKEDKARDERMAGRKLFFPKYDVDNCFKPIQDALDFRADTNEGRDENGEWRDGKKLGLVVDDQSIVEIHGKRHERRDGEQTGFYWRLRRLNGKKVETDVSVANREMTQGWVSEHQRVCAIRNAEEDRDHTDKWETALSDGTFDALRRTQIRLALLTTDETPLDPVIAQHYVALSRLFDRNTAAALVFEEQNRVNVNRALGRDADSILCEVEQDVGELVNEKDVEVPEISERMNIRQLNDCL